ncbi:hypothetical protein GJ496_000867 [Pomphorhynchus laevis]|nr:hypothetical protein GJ496_000867 [Pomphorhynchus laevis]
MPFSLETSPIPDIQSAFQNQIDFKDGDIEISFKPFLHGIIRNFCGINNCNGLVNFCNKNIPYSRIKNDLYNFEQSGDIASQLEPDHSYFKDLLLTKFPEFIGSAFHVNLNKKIVLTSSRYSQGDYLLCHNDLVGKNKEYRKFAFVYYLQCVDSGGELVLFQSKEGNSDPVKICQSIKPEADCLVFFEVSAISYHQFHQCKAAYRSTPQTCFSAMTKRDNFAIRFLGFKPYENDYQNQNDRRLSIHGWFHWDTPCDVSHFSSDIHNAITAPDESCTPYTFINLINPLYLDPDVQLKVANLICSQGNVMLSSFLTDEFYNEICQSLHLLEWELSTPYNKRCYWKAKTESMEKCEVIRRLIDFFKCNSMMITLSNLCDLNFDKDPARNENESESYTVDKDSSVTLSYELRRIDPGSYSLLWSTNEENTCSEDSNLDKTKKYLWTSIFFDISGWNEECGGRTVFARNNCEDEELHVDPGNNCLNLVNTDSNVKPFLLYCKISTQQNTDKPYFYQLVVTYRE